MNHAVILAGGAGERFWPASTPERPKQLMALVSEKTMLRETAERLDGLVPPERRFVLTNAALVDAVRSECPEIPAAHVIGEPVGRNTAPAIGLAAGLIHAHDPDAVLLVLPADHAIGNAVAFRASAEAAFEIAAEHDVIVLFGIVPTRPETGYGYIERGQALDDSRERAYEVASFREKPDAATAGRLWRDGNHTWNSGLFCGRAEVFLAEFERHLPLMRKAIARAMRQWGADPGGALERFYAGVESTSIDYGIMQSTQSAAVLPAAEWGWDDVGSWESLARWIEADPDGNVTVGDCELEGCANVIAFSQKGRLAALGMSDCVIVRTADATLVAARADIDALKPFVQAVTAEA